MLTLQLTCFILLRVMHQHDRGRSCRPEQPPTNQPTGPRGGPVDCILWWESITAQTYVHRQIELT